MGARALPDGYDSLLRDLKQRIRSAQMKAVLAENRELILLYWHIAFVGSQYAIEVGGDATARIRAGRSRRISSQDPQSKLMARVHAERRRRKTGAQLLLRRRSQMQRLQEPCPLPHDQFDQIEQHRQHQQTRPQLHHAADAAIPRVENL